MVRSWMNIHFEIAVECVSFKEIGNIEMIQYENFTRLNCLFTNQNVENQRNKSEDAFECQCIWTTHQKPTRNRFSGYGAKC